MGRREEARIWRGFWCVYVLRETDRQKDNQHKHTVEPGYFSSPAYPLVSLARYLAG